MKPIRISYPASAELADAVRWYEQKRIGLGGEFFDAVIHAIELLSAFALRSVPLPVELASGFSRDFPIG